jgi:hypothetical protein
MDVKMTFLNGDLEERVYMKQPKGFIMDGKKNLGCHLKKSIYGLKQASRQWYLKFNETIKRFGYKENVEDNCIYAKFKNGKYIFLILYVMISFLLAVMLVCYEKQRSSCPQILILKILVKHHMFWAKKFIDIGKIEF